jgi:hypothetical protein
MQQLYAEVAASGFTPGHLVWHHMGLCTAAHWSFSGRVKRLVKKALTVRDFYLRKISVEIVLNFHFLPHPTYLSPFQPWCVAARSPRIVRGQCHCDIIIEIS